MSYDKYIAAGVDPEQAGALIRGLMKGVDADSPLPKDFYCQLVSLPDWLGSSESYLAIGTDGVGTKLLLGLQTGCLSGIGQDLVGMVYNDLITCGGQPFAFLDYYATGKLEPGIYESVIRSIQTACAECAMPLLGGETAEMPGLYQGKEFDLAGFGVAGVRRKDILDPAHTVPGDVLVGIPSSGFHSNGYSLIRKVIADQGIDLGQSLTLNGQTRAIQDWLMAPTRLYVDVISAIRAHDIEVISLAHITGGGYIENLPRSLADSCGAELRAEAFQLPHCDLFHWFGELAGMTQSEVLATFNGGYGMILVCRPAAAEAVLDCLPGSQRVGQVTERKEIRVEFV